jgi:SAM-dependent methyltransferase
MPNWDERYGSGEHGMQHPSPLLKKAIQNLKPGRALDSACGVGHHAIFLAEHGWQVTAVDSSRVGVDILTQRAREAGVSVDAHVANLEKHEFQIERDAYDLICDFYYLQNDLFPAIRAGVRSGGTFVAAIHLDDGNTHAKPHNPAFLLKRGELKSLFSDWEITYYREGPSDEGGHHHDTAYLIARKPRSSRA